MKKLFISRHLKPNSPFYTRLSAIEFSITAESLIAFSKVEIEAVPASDILFFYSKNAVRFAAKNPSLQTAIAQRKLATMGKGTAHVLESLGYQADFIGSAQPAETAKRLSEAYPKETILFLRASQSKQSIQTFLPKGSSTYDLVVYNNEARTDFEIPKSDLLIFTSPINAQAYFGKHPLLAHQKVLAIGYTTAQALLGLRIEKVLIANEPNESALVDLVLQNTIL